MKKVIAALLALVTVMTLALSAAATDINANGAMGVGTQSGEAYALRAASAPTTNISVDIVWTEMTFTYRAASKGTWSAATHSYSNPTVGGWDSSEKATITVTNHSNTVITTDISFDATLSGIKGKFTSSNLIMASAADEQYQQSGTVPSASTEFSIDPTSSAIDANKVIGSITVSIKKGAWRQVGTFSELNAALARGENVTLTSNITVDAGSAVSVPAGAGTATEPLIINLNSKTINGQLQIKGTSAKRSYVEAQNGSINGSIGDGFDHALIEIEYATVTLLSVKAHNNSKWSPTIRNGDGGLTTFDHCIIRANFYSSEVFGGIVAIYDTTSKGEDYGLVFQNESAMKCGDTNAFMYIASNNNVTFKAYGMPFEIGDKNYIDTSSGDKSFDSNATSVGSRYHPIRPISS